MINETFIHINFLVPGPIFFMGSLAALIFVAAGDLLFERYYDMVEVKFSSGSDVSCLNMSVLFGLFIALFVAMLFYLLSLMVFFTNIPYGQLILSYIFYILIFIVVGLLLQPARLFINLVMGR